MSLSGSGLIKKKKQSHKNAKENVAPQNKLEQKHTHLTHFDRTSDSKAPQVWLVG